jgi:hypothetical protein
VILASCSGDGGRIPPAGRYVLFPLRKAHAAAGGAKGPVAHPEARSLGAGLHGVIGREIIRLM